MHENTKDAISATVILFIITCVIILIMGWLSIVFPAYGKDDGRYANSPLKSWFDSLRSGKGPCCSDADGTALSDVDWETKGGNFRVRIDGQWWDVPDEAVLHEPNRVGRTMVWPIYYRPSSESVRIEIRCFLPGSMG